MREGITAARAVPAAGQLVCTATVGRAAGVVVVPVAGVTVGTLVLLLVGSGVCPTPVPDGDGTLQAASITMRQQSTANTRISRNGLLGIIYFPIYV